MEEDVGKNTVESIPASAKTSIHLIALDFTVDKNETQMNTKHDTIAMTLGEDSRVTSFLDYFEDKT